MNKLLSLINVFRRRIRGFEFVSPSDRKYGNNGAIPVRADKGACAYDMFSPIDVIIQPNEQILIWTDVKAYMELDEVLILNVRSSQGKPRVQLANTQGWIDSTYYNNVTNDGNIGVYLRNEGTFPYEIKQGDRICQVMFQKYLVADNDTVLKNTRTGGFGSSGK